MSLFELVTSHRLFDVAKLAVCSQHMDHCGHCVPGAAGGTSGSSGPASAGRSPEGGSASDQPVAP